MDGQTKSIMVFLKVAYLPGEVGYSLIWVIRFRAAGQGMVLWPRCPEQGINLKADRSICLEFIGLRVMRFRSELSCLQ